MIKLPKELEASLRQKLRDAAMTALPHDVSIMVLEEVLRDELVKAAATFPAVKKANGSVSKSKLAAFTGLSRKEVLRLFRDSVDLALKSRPLDVVRAWQKKTRKRRIDRKAFDQLVKDHAHDIPPRAMLSVMQWRGYATEMPNETVLLQALQEKAK